MVLSFCMHPSSCTVPWWWPLLEVEPGCHMINIRKRACSSQRMLNTVYKAIGLSSLAQFIRLHYWPEARTRETRQQCLAIGRAAWNGDLSAATYLISGANCALIWTDRSCKKQGKGTKLLRGQRVGLLEGIILTPCEIWQIYIPVMPIQLDPSSSIIITNIFIIIQKRQFRNKCGLRD